MLSLKMEKWCLVSDNEGFAAQLLSCFDRDGLSSEEYKDLLEQKLWAFHRSSNGSLYETQKRRPKGRVFTSEVPPEPTSASRRRW